MLQWCLQDTGFRQNIADGKLTSLYPGSGSVFIGNYRAAIARYNNQ